MISNRTMLEEDYPALESAMARDTFHPGLWKLPDFQEKRAHYEIFEDEQGIIVFVKYLMESAHRIRICTVWNQPEDIRRNGRAIVLGINQLVNKIRGSQFTEIVFNTTNEKLSNFCIRILKFEDVGDGEYVRQVKE